MRSYVACQFIRIIAIVRYSSELARAPTIRIVDIRGLAMVVDLHFNERGGHSVIDYLYLVTSPHGT